MKRSCHLFLSLLLILAIINGMVLTVRADSMVETITGIGTTQAFSSDEVPEEDIRAILQAGLSAASAINQQPWFLAAVTNRELMQEIAGSGAGFSSRPDTPPEGMEKPEGGMPEGGMPEGMEKPEGNMPADMKEGMPQMPPSSTGAKAGLGDSPLAIIIYMDTATSSPDPDFDCGLAAQNMVLASASLGYGVKIVSSPTMALNGEKHDEICEKLGVDPALKAIAVLLIGHAADTADEVSSASVREPLESKTSIVP